MLKMLVYSVRSFFQGNLFRDYRAAFIQWMKGFLLTLALLVIVGYFAGALAGVIVASLIGGALGPLLFKHIKYG